MTLGDACKLAGITDPYMRETVETVARAYRLALKDYGSNLGQLASKALDIQLKARTITNLVESFKRDLLKVPAEFPRAGSDTAYFVKTAENAKANLNRLADHLEKVRLEIADQLGNGDPASPDDGGYPTIAWRRYGSPQRMLARALADIWAAENGAPTGTVTPSKKGKTFFYDFVCAVHEYATGSETQGFKDIVKKTAKDYKTVLHRSRAAMRQIDRLRERGEHGRANWISEQMTRPIFRRGFYHFF